MATLVNIFVDNSADIKHLHEQSVKDLSDETEHRKYNEMNACVEMNIDSNVTLEQDCCQDISKVHINGEDSKECVSSHINSLKSELPFYCEFQENKAHTDKQSSVGKPVITREDINGGIDSEDTFPELGIPSDGAYHSDELELNIQNCKHKSASDTEEFGEKGLLRFAEVLLKCTLCTSIPIILTSEKCFLRHIKEQHLKKNTKAHSCEKCSLTFRTKEDLKEHTLFFNTGSDEGRSCDFVGGNEVMMSQETLTDSNNDSDSDSSGHRQLRAKSSKKTKVMHDFERPKQLVDHTGIQTLNGSLDLSKKQKNANETYSLKGSKENYCQGPKSRSSKKHFNLNFITEQIMKSDVQFHSQSNDETLSHKLPFVPSFTAEFGEYTKLVREGGNIVYFCQLCNWKSPMKANFQLHCNMTTHKNKLTSAENPSNSDGDSDTLNSPMKPNGETKPNGIPKIKNNSAKTMDRLLWDTKYTCFSPKLNNNYFQQLRGITTFQGRTPVVSAYSNDLFVEDAHLSHKRLCDLPLEMAVKKRKKSHKQTQYIGKTRSNSDSDGDTKWQGFENGFDCALAGNLKNSILTGGKSPEGNFNREHPKHFDYINDTAVCHNQSFPDRTKDVNANKILLGSSAIKSEKGDCKKIVQNASSAIKSEKGDCKKIVQNASVFSSNSTRVKQETHLEDYILGDQWSSAPNGNVLKYPSLKFYKCHLCLYECYRSEEYEQHFQKVHFKNPHASNQLSAMPHKRHGSQFNTFQQNIYGSNSYTLAQNRYAWQSGSGMRDADHAKLLHSLGSQYDTLSKQEPDSEGRLDVKDEDRAAEPSSSHEMGENWRVQKLKDLLFDYVVTNEKGNVSKDFLLQCISDSSGLSDVVLWSSACNRAIRELYPNSQALRKGKYKNYYFGITMLERFQGQEEITNVEGEPLQNQLHKDVNLEMEKIVDHLHIILSWTGNLDSGVYRHEVLEILADMLHNHDIVNCGAQCNRAMRAIFPLVNMKRQGKYKTTMYLGVKFKNSLQNGFVQQRKSECLISEHSMKGLASSDKTIQHKSKDQNLAVILHEVTTSPENIKDNIQNKVHITQLPSCYMRDSPEKESEQLQKECCSSELLSQFLNDNCDIHNDSSKNGSPNSGPRDDQLIRDEIQSEMDEYLTKFGGVSKCEHLKVKVRTHALLSGATQKGDVHINSVIQDSDSFQSSLVQDGDSHLSSLVQNGDDNDGDDELDSVDSVSISKR